MECEGFREAQTHTRGSDDATPNIGRNYISHNSCSCIHKHQKQTRICGQTQMHKYGHRHSGTLGHKTSPRRADRCGTENSQVKKTWTRCACTQWDVRKLWKEWQNITQTYTRTYTADRREYKLRERWGIVWRCQAAGLVLVETRCICVHLI